MRCWARFKAWLQRLLPEPARSPPAVIAPREIDWYLYECALFRAGRAPWHDYRRYDGSELAWPRPTQAQMDENYRRAAQDAKTRHDPGLVVCAAVWAAKEARNIPLPVIMAEPDPIRFLIDRYRDAGAPPQIITPDVERQAEAYLCA